MEAGHGCSNISFQTDEVGSNLVRTQPSGDADVKQTLILVKIDAGAYVWCIADGRFWCTDSSTGGGGGGGDPGPSAQSVHQCDSLSWDAS